MSGSNGNSFGNSIFDAMTNPGLDALLGMTQGFAQAAMPTRMPTPLGAVLGMGVGGALPGIAAGQQLRHAGIANQQAQMGLDWYKNAMNPQGGQGAPFGAPVASGGSGGGTPDANGNYLIPPRTLASMAQLMIAQGKDPAGVMKLVESYSGGGGYAMDPSGRAFAVPGGSADPGVAGRLAAAKGYGESSGSEAGREPYQPPVAFERQVPDANGKNPGDPGYVTTIRKDYLTPRQAHGAATGQQSSAVPTSGMIPASAWAGQLNQTENDTGNPAARNPRSSATGNGQFLDSTWIDQVRKNYPDQAANMSDADILKMRADPTLSHQMTMSYGAENSGVLQKAGLPANATTLAAAHKLGPDAAVKVLQVARSAPQTPLSSILPDNVMAANPQLARQTAGSYYFGLNGQFGGAPVDFGRGAVPSQSVANYSTTSDNIPAPGTAPPQAAPAPMIRVPPQQPGPDQFAGPGAPHGQPMGIPGAPVLTPDQTVEQERRIAAAKATVEPPVTFNVQAPDGKSSYEVNVPRASLAGVGPGAPNIDLNHLPPGATIGKQTLYPAAAQELERHKPQLIRKDEDLVLDPGAAVNGGQGPLLPGQQSGVSASPQGGGVITNSSMPIEKLKTYLKSATDDAALVSKDVEKAASGMPVLSTTSAIRAMLPDVTTGKTADARLLTSQWGAAAGLSPTATEKYFGTNPVMGELLQKKLFELSTGAVRGMGAREPGSVISMFNKNYPNMESREMTIDAMTRLLDMDQIRNQDYAQEKQLYHNESVKGITPETGYRGVGGFDSEFEKTHPPRVYVSAALAAGGLPFNVWTRGLSPHDQVDALRMAERVYPDVSVFNKNGIRQPLVRPPAQSGGGGG